MDINDVQRVVSRKLTEHKVLSGQIDQISKEYKSAESEISNMVEARNIIAEASRITQEQFKEFVESLITLAIQSVFPDKDYKFIVDFVLQANRSQIFLMVQQGDKEPYLPEDEQGGCLLDIISFALRIVLWSLEKPRSRNVLIFDEPFRWTGALTEKAANMMKEISGKLDIQIIMVTHDERLSEVADRSWHVTRDKRGVSVLSLLN